MGGDSRLVRFRNVDCEIASADAGIRIALAGEIDISVADELGSWLMRSSEGHDTLALDLTKVAFIDSTGLQLLVRLKRNLESNAQRLRIDAVSEHVKGLLGVTGLSNFFD